MQALHDPSEEPRARQAVHFPADQASRVEPYLPPAPLQREPSAGAGRDRPFVTVTYATSLDSTISLARGMYTAISGHQSMAMTQFLRNRHAAILIGAGAAVSDDPGLNCRLAGDPRQPRPVVLDPQARWRVSDESEVLRRARRGVGRAPLVLASAGMAADVPLEQKEAVERHGGKYIFLKTVDDGRFAWPDVLGVLGAEGLDSVMVEGGAEIINSLLRPPNSYFIDSVIVTVAPVWLGKGGVVVSPDRPEQSAPVARLTDVTWLPLGEDVVLCGRMHTREQPRVQ